MKKQLWIICLLILVSVGILLILITQSRNAVALDMEVVPISQVNYNNYITENRLDYKENSVAWQNSSLFGEKLTLLNENGEYSVIPKVAKPFQLLQKRVVFLKNGELIQYSFGEEQKYTIANNVSRFIAMEQAVFYLTDSALFQYSWEQKNAVLLKNNIVFFYVHQKSVYSIDAKGQLMRLNDDWSWQDLCLLQINSYPFYVMPQGDCLISRQGNKLCYINIYTGITETIRLAEGDYANNRIGFVCDDDNLFVSFQATKTYGSIVKNITNDINGVWSIDFHTKETRKICEDVFDQLYLFEGNRLFGVKNNQLYQINTESGSLKIIAQ